MKKWIVSSNYRDRSSPYRWLVRRASESPTAARAFKSVKATDVVFQRSSSYEQGFGCEIIATAEHVDCEGPEEAAAVVSLRFELDRFLDSQGRIVEAAAELHLHEDGEMTAVAAAA
ncbi:MAG TPA: hypothetical protein VGH74_15550 [Planctomycetaceae bacterium]|jgi:hypothetical protein